MLRIIQQSVLWLAIVSTAIGGNCLGRIYGANCIGTEQWHVSYETDIFETTVFYKPVYYSCAGFIEKGTTTAGSFSCTHDKTCLMGQFSSGIPDCNTSNRTTAHGVDYGSFVRNLYVSLCSTST